MKKIIAIVALLTTFAFSQDEFAKFGVRAGLNLASMAAFTDYTETEISSGRKYSEKSDIGTHTGNSIGFHVGAIADIKILDFFYIQPGLMFTRKGGEINNEESGGSGGYDYKREMAITPYYIDIPVMLSLKGTLTNDVYMRAHVGPYFGIGLFGEATTESKYEYSEEPERNRNNKQTRNIFTKTTIDEDEFDAIMNRFNFGIGFGVGFEISSFYLGVNYNYGLTNLYMEEKEEGYKLEENGGMYERTLGITLGYNF